MTDSRDSSGVPLGRADTSGLRGAPDADPSATDRTPGTSGGAAGAGVSPVVRSRRLSPRRRARLWRGVQYAILLVAVVAVLSAVDRETFTTSVFNLDAARAMLPDLPGAFVNTLTYMLGAFAVGLVLGTVLALMKLSSVAPYRAIATVYIEFFRGIPALLVVLGVAYGVPLAFDLRIDSLIIKIAIALGLVSAAYIAETLRAGIAAVPRGQIEAARSLGMSHSRTMITVVIPQAFRIVLPPMTNEIILLTKDTSLVYLMGVTQAQFELTKVGNNALNSSAGGGMTGLVVAGLCYLVITIPLGFVARHLERRGTKGAAA
ncbi:hypothetical protein GCM10011331_01920 [Flavimobilis marinus]|uniref:Amino acid ABC transporter membrane protein, PAAT family n=1 Tax=Flavimobilis marinus TaxID=285351 RepID=A0A1I2DZZ5_9MICO|nr:amino acid ABC transporter permease [Flavimobilis marinus]GHG43944.1 hypothetical protein GCM10011331_01920 [Flavimobilis marinus]SFE85893.1 amino acid ABC transporter membrane protein, PAAT family [Flavimobilis marinus]